MKLLLNSLLSWIFPLHAACLDLEGCPSLLHFHLLLQPLVLSSQCVPGLTKISGQSWHLQSSLGDWHAVVIACRFQGSQIWLGFGVLNFDL